MSRSLEEVIRIKLESAGVENVDALVKAFSELEQSGELTQAELSGLVDKLTAVTDAAGDIKGIEAAIDSYRTLGEQQKALAEATDYAGLRLQAAVRAENENAQVLAEKRAITAQAREELERYSATLDKTSSGLKERRDAVREAAAAEREASKAYNDSAKAVTGAVTAFDRAAEAQEKLNERLGDAGKTIAEAGLSTDDLAKAQAELATRSEAAGASVAAMVRDAEQAAEANRALARATAEAAAAAVKAEKDFEEAFRSLGGAGALRDTTAEIQRLESAYETLASSGKLSTEQLERAQEQLQQRIQRLREGTAEYRAEQERAAQAQAQAASFAAELARETAKAADESKEFADGVKRLESSTKSAAAGQEQLGNAVQRNSGIFDKLKGVLASVTAYLGFREAVEGVKNILSIGDAAEGTRLRFTQLFGSIEAGNAAMEKIRDIARDNGLAFQQTADAAARMKSFGLDPLNGSMQALIDQNAALGGSQETLEGIILAVGQAWAKQKLQGEEILQLVERGVPVWDLLAQATGRSVGELQKMSEQGLLTRDVIAQLMVEIGKANEGAAAAGLSRLSTLITGLRERYVQFAEYVNNSGTFEYFRGRLLALNQTIDTMVRDGRMAQWAQQVSDAIVGAARAMESGARWVVEYSGAIMSVVKAYVAVRTVQATMRFADMIAGWHRTAAATLAASTAANTAATGFARLGTVIRAIPTTIKIGIAFIGYELLEKTALKLAEIAARNSEAAKELERAQAARAAQVQEEINQLHLLQAETIRYRDVQVQSAVDIAKMTADELAQYQERIELSQEYARQQLGVALRERELRGETEETNRAVADAIARVQELRGAWDTVAEGTRLAEEASRRAMSVDATLLVTQLQSAAGEAEKTRLAVASMFEGLEDASVTGLGDIALAIAEVGSESDRAARHVREGLAEELKKLTGEQLLRFSSAAQAAFDQFGVGAQQAATVANSVLLTAMERLGLKGAQLGVAITDSGRDIIATFQVIAESAHASAEQVQNAFRAALDAAATIDEVKALEAAFQSAFAAGRISADQLAVGMQAIQTRMAAIRAEIDPMADAFRTLGIQSQASLDAARDAARGAFDRIVAGAREGKAALTDIQAAFEAYARAELAAAANMDATTRQQVEAMLRIKGGAIGATEALERLGLVGADAPIRIAPPAEYAAGALDGMADAAARAGSSIEAMGESADEAGARLDNLAAGAESVSFSWGVVSDATDEMLRRMSTTRSAFITTSRDATSSMGVVINEVLAQRDALAEANKALDAHIAKYDPLAERLQQLRKQYHHLADADLMILAQKQAQLEKLKQQESAQGGVASGARATADAYAEQNKQLTEQQKNLEMLREQNTRRSEITVNFVAAAAKIEFDPSAISDAQWRQVAARVIEIIKRDMQ